MRTGVLCVLALQLLDGVLCFAVSVFEGLHCTLQHSDALATAHHCVGGGRGRGRG
jgi:hypothetical protein